MTDVKIIGISKHYMKTGDIIEPETDTGWGWSQDSIIRLTTDGSFYRSGLYLNERFVRDDDPEGLYYVNTWTINTTYFYLYKDPLYSIWFYILKKPRVPSLITSVSDKTVTLEWVCSSLQIWNTHIDWGDGTSTDTVNGTVLHTYAQNGAYTISVTCRNACDLTSEPATKSVLIGTQVELIPHDAVYLLRNMRIVKPIHGTYRIVFDAAKATATITMPYDPEVKCGMQIYLYHMFPQVFVIESISGERTITVTCVDFLTALLKGRIVYTGTNSGNGQKVYSGNGGMIIPRIIMDNLSGERITTNVLAPEERVIGNNISIRARYSPVADVLSDAIDQSGLVLRSRINTVDVLVVVSELTVPSVRNINMTTKRLCGEPVTRTYARLATTALVAGEGTGAERETAWRGDLESKSIDRVETYVDGGDSTETNALTRQAGDSIVWNLSPKSPYKPYRDFWIGDTICVDGIPMVLTTVDYAVTNVGKSINLTFGRDYQLTEKTVAKINAGITPDYR